MDMLKALEDCGFQEAAQKQYLMYEKENRRADLLQLLYRQRAVLLGDLHTAQIKMDRIDFVIHAVEQKEESL